jgi:peptidyl-prolyl cis-trans isomerase SurA
MLALLLLLQTSLLARPTYLGEEPPPLRSARSFQLFWKGAERAPAETTRTKEEATELARELVLKLRAGEELRAVLDRAQLPGGEVLGTFAPGMLAPELDRFLFGAEVGAYSDPLVLTSSVRVLQRIETHAAVLQILAAGPENDPAAHAAARERAEAWHARLKDGVDFAKLAGEVSEDEPSRKRGGQFAIYERGTRDKMLKAAAFELPIGGIGGPYESPLGWHLIRRVPLAEVDPGLKENNFVRLRSILLRHEDAAGVDRATARRQIEAKQLADRIALRLDRGEDMIALAREFDEDPGGAERAGDLGWVYRFSPELLPILREGFYIQVGTHLPPRPTPFGWMVLRRDW